MTPRGDMPSGSSARHEGSSQLVNCERWLASMDHGVTVGAHGSQVLDRIQRVSFSVGADRDEVVHVNEAFAKRAVGFLEGEPAHCAAKAVSLQAGFPCARIPLVAVDEGLLDGALDVPHAGGQLVWQRERGPWRDVRIPESLERHDELGRHLETAGGRVPVHSSEVLLQLLDGEDAVRRQEPVEASGHVVRLVARGSACGVPVLRLEHVGGGCAGGHETAWRGSLLQQEHAVAGDDRVLPLLQRISTARPRAT